MNPASRRALLIDDEPLARLELRRLLKAHPAVTIVGEAATLTEARAALGRGDYDLVFLDVQLRGGSGFDVLDAIAPEAHIVFVTAYDRYAVRAFDVNALDYLLKPVTAARLAASLQRLDAPASENPVAAPARERLTVEDRVFVKTGNATSFVPLVQIAAIKSCENYTEVLLTTGEKLLVLRPLKAWEEMLPEDRFVRVHRQAVVNLAQVRRIVRAEGDDVSFELIQPAVAIAASRRRLAELRHRFAAAGLEGLLP